MLVRKSRRASRAHRWLFTFSLTCLSKGILARDRRIGRLPEAAPEVAAKSVVTRHRIASGRNMLDAVVVTPVGRVDSALLICHGIGETVDHWLATQQFLAAHGAVTLVFDYSGYGRSTGSIGVEQLERDAEAAFAFLQEQVPGLPVSIMGFSLGSGIAAAVISRVRAESLVLCASFTSFRDAALSGGLPGWMRFAVPPIWHSAATVGDCAVPVMIVHGSADRLFPARMAQELHGQCGEAAELVLVPGMGHNEPYLLPKLAYWGPVLRWIGWA